MEPKPNVPARVMVRMSRSLHSDLRALAELEGVSLNQLIVGALTGLAARRAQSGRGDADAEAAVLEIGRRVDQADGELVGLSAQASAAEGRIAALERAARVLVEQLEELDADSADSDARLQDLEDEWYVARANTFRTGLIGVVVSDPGERERRERLRERAEPRFDRLSGAP